MKRVLCVILTCVCGTAFGGHGHFVRQQAIVVPVQPYYYTVEQQKQAPVLNGTDVDSLLQNAAEYERLTTGLLRIKADGVGTATQQLQRLTTSPGSNSTDTVSVTSAGTAEQLLIAKCAKCHTGTSSKGGAQLVENGRLTGDWLDSKSRRAIVGYVVDGTMPPAPEKPLTDDEVQTLITWSKGK